MQDRATPSTTERRSMSPLYIRPESLSPKDLSLVLLVSTPAEISKLYPCVLLISHHSGPRLSRGFYSTTVLLSLLLSLLDKGVFRPYLDTCGDTLRWKRLHLPAKFDAFFLGTRLKMPEPTKKGRSADHEDGIRTFPLAVRMHAGWFICFIPLTCWIVTCWGRLSLSHCFEVTRVSCFLAAVSFIPVRLLCQPVLRNPQSDFDFGVVLLMPACFSHPKERCKKGFELCEQIQLLA